MAYKCSNTTKRCKHTYGKDWVNPCCQSHILEILDFVTMRLDKNNIKYWLDYGTLLGAVREGEIIKWDDDADISILQEDKPRLVEALSGHDFFKGPREVEKRDSFNQMWYSESNNLHIDIFAWHVDKDMLRRYRYLDDGPKSTDARKGKGFPKEWVETLSKIKFGNKEYWCPADPEQFCKFRYGRAWATPMGVGEWNQVDKKKNKIFDFGD